MGVRIPRLYSGEDGQSHWDEVEVEMQSRGPGLGSETLPTTGISFSERTGGSSTAWHNTGRRVLIVTLSGEVEFETGDGTIRRFGPGSMVVAEDGTGAGHIARVTADRLSLSIPLPDPIATAEG